MKTTIKVLSIIAVVLGGIAILSAFGETSADEIMRAIVGGSLFLGYGICVLVYLKNENK